MQHLLFKEKKLKLEYGGSLLKGRRKGKRPVTLSKPLHLVMRSEVAIGKLSLMRFQLLIKARLEMYALQFHIKIYKFAINRTHLHLCIQGQDREEITSFLKAFAGVIAKKIMLHSKIKINKFWSERVFSRVIQWGRDYRGVIAYIEKNEQEANGKIHYTPRKKQKKKSYGPPSECHKKS
jgi:REP element-mobilizing transposase RayT